MSPIRDWLIANIVNNLTGGTQDFSAISEPMLASMDVLPTIQTAHGQATDAIKELLVSKGRLRSKFSDYFIAGPVQTNSGSNEAFVLGAGMRRRTRVWKENDE